MKKWKLLGGLPLLLLLVCGCLLVIWGTADILRSRREHDE